MPSSRALDHGIDPDFETKRRLSVYYTYLEPPARSRLSRFAYDEVTDLLTEEQVVQQRPPLGTEIQNGGCLEFTPDNTLFLGMGDDFSFSSTAQDPFDLRGAILHLNRDGTGVMTNIRTFPVPQASEASASPITVLGFGSSVRIACSGVSELTSRPPGLDDTEVGVDLDVQASDQGDRRMRPLEPAPAHSPRWRFPRARSTRASKSGPWRNLRSPSPAM